MLAINITTEAPPRPARHPGRVHAHPRPRGGSSLSFGEALSARRRSSPVIAAPISISIPIPDVDPLLLCTPSRSATTVAPSPISPLTPGGLGGSPLLLSPFPLPPTHHRGGGHGDQVQVTPTTLRHSSMLRSRSKRSTASSLRSSDTAGRAETASAAAGSEETAPTSGSSLGQMQDDLSVSEHDDPRDRLSVEDGDGVHQSEAQKQKQRRPNSSKRISKRPSNSRLRSEESESEHTQMVYEAAGPQTRTLHRRNSDLSRRRLSQRSSRSSLRRSPTQAPVGPCNSATAARPASHDTLSGDEADGEDERSVEGWDAQSDVEVEELHEEAKSSARECQAHTSLRPALSHLRTRSLGNLPDPSSARSGSASTPRSSVGAVSLRSSFQRYRSPSPSLSAPVSPARSPYTVAVASPRLGRGTSRERSSTAGSPASFTSSEADATFHPIAPYDRALRTPSALALSTSQHLSRSSSSSSSSHLSVSELGHSHSRSRSDSMSSLGRSGPRNLILTPDRAEKRMSLAQMMRDQQFELESEMETLRQLDEAGRGRPTAVDEEREVRRGQADEAGNPYAKLYAEILKSPVEVDDAPALSAAHPFPHSLNPSAATEPTCPPPSGPLPTPPRPAASATGSLFPPTSLETVAEALDEPSTCSYIDLEELDFDETTMHTAVEWETGVAIDDTMHPYTVNHGSQRLQTRRSSDTVSLEGTAQTHLFGATPAHFASCATLSSVNSAQDAVVQQRSSVIIEHANRPAIVSRFTETGLDASEERLRDEHQPAQYQPRVLARAVSEGALQHNISAKPALVPYAPLFVTPARSSLSSTGRHTNTGNSVPAGRARKPLSSRPSLWFLKPSPSLPSISKGQSASKGSGVKLSRTKRGSASSTSASANTARSGSTSVSVRELGISAPLTDSARHVATGALNPHPNRESPFGRRAESPVEGYVTAAAAPSLPSRLAAGTPFMSAISEASSSQDYSSPFIAFTSPALSSTSSHSHSHSESAGPLTPIQHTWSPFDGSYPTPPQPDHLGKLQAEASALSEHASGQDFWAVDFAEAEAAEGDFIARHWESMHHRRTGLASSQQYRTSGSVSRTAGKLAVSQEERERRRQSQTVWRSRSRASNRSASMLSP